MLKQIAGVFINDAGIFLVQGIISVFVARALGPGMRGVYGVASVMATLTSTLALFGISNALTYNVSRAADQRRGLAEALAVVLRGAPVFATVVLGVYLVAATPLVHRWLPGVGVATLCASLGLSFAVLLQSLVVNTLQGLRAFTVRNGVLSATSFCQAGTVGAILVSGTRLTPAILLWTSAAAMSAPALIGALTVLRQYAPPVRVGPPADWRTSYVGYGLKSYVNIIALSVNYRLDALLVNAMAGNAGAGLYGVAVTAAELLLWVPNAVANVLYPHIAAASKHDPRRYASAAVGASVYVVSLGAIVLAIAGPTLLTLLFGTAFRTSAGALWWLLPGMVALAGCRTLSAAVNGLGHPECTAAATLVGTGLTVTADLLLVPRWGIRGAAAASSIAYTASMLVLLRSYAALVSTGPWALVREMLVAPRLAWSSARLGAGARDGD